MRSTVRSKSSHASIILPARSESARSSSSRCWGTAFGSEGTPGRPVSAVWAARMASTAEKARSMDGSPDTSSWKAAMRSKTAVSRMPPGLRASTNTSRVEAPAKRSSNQR